MLLNEMFLNEYKTDELDLYGRKNLLVYKVASLHNLTQLVENIGDLRGCTVGKQVWFWKASEAGHHDVFTNLNGAGYGDHGAYDLYITDGVPQLHGIEWEDEMAPVEGTDIYVGVYAKGRGIMPYTEVEHRGARRLLGLS